MQIGFANSGFVPAPETVLRRGGAWRWRDLRVRYGVLRHPVRGVWLIDTGIGPQALSAPGRGFALRAYAAALRYRLCETQAPHAVLDRMGLRPRDVAGVIVTHFHADHVARLAEFPMARIVAHGPTLARIRAAHDLVNQRHGVFPDLIPQGLEARLTCVTTLPRVALPFGLGEGADLFGDGSCVVVELPGHAAGHFGIAFAEAGLLYACDAAWLREGLAEAQAPGLPLRLVLEDRTAAARSAALAAGWQAAGGQVMLCHDPEPTAFDLPEAGLP
ncbi:MBL fold metallo-hydrolase [Pseudotabrizicola algicola]|uniref:MBL fold metallo-hydrolase n=1 Tax=Pseudotabrizicola algicola TaxID=2709381 RepID=A0A6B3RQJ7_9RHOB|nr:MBL fold metallo-hydrolase [Pseudotabrizicola algicola]NEX47533.1 MBL fold metallo-hydrolase [Pseudotabrizicola algicola]